MRPCGVLALASLLLSCSVSPNRGSPTRRSLQLDSYTTTCVRSPANCPAVLPPLPAAPPPAASATASAVTAAGALVLRDSKPLDELERLLVECAAQADDAVNRRWFGNRGPTKQECDERLEVVTDGCAERIRRAVTLGREKHAVAAACTRKALEEGGYAFSLEPRYRYYRESRFLERVGSEEEARLLAQGCTRELWRTIKPDVVVHASPDRKSPCRIFDFKFPCYPGRRPEWTLYNDTSAFSGALQGVIYAEALGCPALMVSPLGVFP
ncbi:hypothetical protein P2318_31620 [Myxococcaceae bacterium GXIMD 01537]